MPVRTSGGALRVRSAETRVVQSPVNIRAAQKLVLSREIGRTAAGVELRGA